MEEVSHLIIKVSSDDVASATRNLDSLGKASDRITGLIKGLVTVAATLAVFKTAAQAIAEFDHNMQGVKAVTQATAIEMERMADVARRFGGTTKFSGSEAALGMKMLGQAGFNTAKIIAAMPGMLDLATAGELDLASAADITTAALAGFQLQASDSAKVADVLAVAAGESNTSVFQMGDAMKYVAPIGAAMGKSIEEVSAAIGVLSNAGLQGSMAGTGLRQVLSSLASPTKEAVDVLSAYGVKVDEVNPEIHSLAVVIDRLKAAGISASDALTIAGDRGGNALVALTSQAEGFHKLNGSMQNVTGRAREMAIVMGDTLGGDFKKLQGATGELWLALGDAGLRTALRDVTQETVNFTLALGDLVKSGEAAAWVDLLITKLSLLSDGFTNASINISETWHQLMIFLGNDGKEGADNITNAFINMPENIRAVVQSIGAILGGISATQAVVYDSLKEISLGYWEYVIATGKNMGREMIDQFKTPFIELGIWIRKTQISTAEALNKILPKDKQYGENWFAPLRKDIEEYQALLSNTKNDFWSKQKTIAGEYEEKVTTALKAVKDGFYTNIEAVEAEIVAIMDNRDTNIKVSDDKLKKIGELKTAYAQLKQARLDAEKETAKNAGTVGTPPPDTTPKHFNAQEFEALRKSLQLEEKTIAESYDKRLELILKNTEAGGALQVELVRELNLRVNEEYESAFSTRADRILEMEAALREAIATGHTGEAEGLQLALEGQEAALRASYERRRQSILDDTKITESQRLKLLTTLESRYSQQQLDQEKARREANLTHAAGFFGNLATIAGAFGKKGHKIAQAAAIAQTMIKTYESATSAYASLAGIPYVGPVLGAAAAAAAIAAGIANVSAIRSQQYAGAYAKGGMIPAGKYGITQEEGAEIVHGPAIVTSARATAGMTGESKGSNMTVIVNNNVGAEVTREERDGPDGKVLEIFLNKAVNKVATDIRQGAGPVSNALSSAFGGNLRRGVA